MAAAVALSWVLLACSLQVSAASAVTWAPGLEARLPADAKPSPDLFPASVSCAAPGECSAVGHYDDTSDHSQGLLLTETAGRWTRGVRALLPSDAAANPVVILKSVSCASPGDCLAVGSYRDNSGAFQGLLLTQTAGTWARGVRASLPADAGPSPEVDLGSVSCAAPGKCSAVGIYTDGSGHAQGLLLTVVAGTVSVEEATLPAAHGTDPNVHVDSVSCGSAGECSAVGDYLDNASRRQGLLLTESGGFWDLGETPTLPAGTATNPSVGLRSVSCSSVGNCGAVGTYEDSMNHIQGLLLSETAGVWASGVEATLPPDAGSLFSVNLRSVSCASTGNCSAVGNYLDSSSHRQGLLISETGGTWGSGVEPLLPAGAATGTNNPEVILDSVSCASAGNCSAVGDYRDNSHFDLGLLLADIAGHWGPGLEAIMPPDAATNPAATLSSVSCPTAADCGAVGSYQDPSGHAQPLVLDTVRGLNVSKAGVGHGSVTSSPTGISCGARCTHGFASGSLVTLTAAPGRGSWFVRWSGACSGRGKCRVKMTKERTVAAHFALLPDTKITKAKIDAARQRAKFRFKAAGSATGFQCALAKNHRKPHFSSCHSPKTYKGLAAGRYTFRVRALNAGGPDPTPAKRKFKLP